MVRRIKSKRNTKHKDTKRKNTKYKNTKRRNTNRRNTNHRNAKRRNTKRRKKTKFCEKTNGKKAGMMNRIWNCITTPRKDGEVFPEPELDVSVEPEPELDVSVEPEPELEPEPEPELDSSLEATTQYTDILSRFFDEKGRLKNRVNIISAHGRSLREFFIIPRGLTLYLTSSAGENAHSRTITKGTTKGMSNDSYIRVYRGGSIIQNINLNFSPFYKKSWAKNYTPRGLLYSYKIPRQLRDVGEDGIHYALINAITSRKKTMEPDQSEYLSERGREDNIEYSHLVKYKDEYFKGNDDSIIEKEGEEGLLDTVFWGRKLKLSDVVEKIVMKKRITQTNPEDWFGLFCRAGEAIDISVLKKCNEKGFGEVALPDNIFSQYTEHNDIDSGLFRQTSISSASNISYLTKFMDTVESIHNHLEKHGTPALKYFSIEKKERFYDIYVNKIEGEVCPVLTKEDVCFILQIKNNIDNDKRRERAGGGISKKVVIKKSTNSKKKYMALFYENDKKIKTTHFGCAGMSDYTKHKDPARKQRYMNRHKSTEDWSKPMSAGALSRYILWNKPTLKASISDYKKRFNYS